MKERPILFSGPMVRAIIAGTKTQTRRPLDRDKLYNGFAFDDPRIARACPYGQPGDRLWVRETWACDEYGRRHQSQGMVYYRADAESMGTWRPPIHMPRWASRIDLEITAVRVERVREISEADACAELGAPLVWPGPDPEPYRRDMIGAFANIWDEIYSKRGYGWDINPWVWVVEFKAVQR